MLCLPGYSCSVIHLLPLQASSQMVAPKHRHLTSSRKLSKGYGPCHSGNENPAFKALPSTRDILLFHKEWCYGQIISIYREGIRSTGVEIELMGSRGVAGKCCILNRNVYLLRCSLAHMRSGNAAQTFRASKRVSTAPKRNELKRHSCFVSLLSSKTSHANHRNITRRAWKITRRSESRSPHGRERRAFAYQHKRILARHMIDLVT